MLEGQFSTSAPSAPAAELTAAAAAGVLLEEENSGAKVRRVSWIADSTYALSVTAQRCRVNANTAMANLACGAWSAVRRLSRVETFHVRSHTGEPGNECADALAELGGRGLRGSSSLVDKLLQCVHQRVARKPEVQELDLYSNLYWSRVLDRNVGAQPVQTKQDRAESDGKVIRLKLGTANVTTLYPREEGSVGVSTRRLQLAQQFRKEGYQVLGLQTVAVIEAEDGTPLLDEAEIAARWESTFFQEFSGRGERVQPKDLGSRLRELRIPWQAQLRPEEWPDEDQLAATPWDGCETERLWERTVSPRSTCARLVQDISEHLRGWLSGHSRKGCRAEGAQVAWFQCPKSRECL